MNPSLETDYVSHPKHTKHDVVIWSIRSENWPEINGR